MAFIRTSSCWLAALLVLALGGCTASAPRTAPPAASTPQGSGGVNAAAQQDKPYVVLVSFDGFRPDYMDRYPAPNFQRVARRGARAPEGMLSVFPSKTFPNHYSIVTGLYADQHGLVANSFYDPARQAMYRIGSPTIKEGAWYRGEPLWNTAETQGMVAASYFWVGSEADIGGVRPTFWKPYDGEAPIESRVDSVLAWLRLPPARRPHFVTLYFSTTDDAGHRFGPGSPEIGAAVGAVDRVLGRLVDGLDALPHGRDVTLVLVSDHGMADYTPAHAVAIESLIDTTGVLVADAGPNANLHVRRGGPERARALRDTLNAKLQHGRAYLRAELPERFHYRNDPRAGDVVVVMETPYLIQSRARLPRTPAATHGWDPETPDMHALFLAMGPGIRAGATIAPFRNVEIYSFVSEILGLRPAPGVQGRPGWLRGALRP